MQYQEYGGINSFLIGVSKLLLKEGLERQTRGQRCFEFPNPIVIKIVNPTARLITIPERKWNFTLPYVESLWLASGRNDMALVGHYVQKMYDFSDDKKFMRAGYGPRLRLFNGIAEDYQSGFFQEHASPTKQRITEIDQFEFVEESFKKDPFTRQGIISIGDPAKDCFEKQHVLKKTKDFPCTRNLQFLRNGDKLDLIVHMRSNDFVWGAGGVNIFNFTFIQEYFARILGLEIGNYYHIANNLHYYGDFKEMLEKIASTDEVKEDKFIYTKTFNNLAEFDEKVKALEKYEKELREERVTELVDFSDDFFDDWAKVLYQFNVPTTQPIDFVNPTLDILAKKKITKKVIADNRNQLVKTFKSSDENSDTISPNNYI
ncbi:MAG: thymidylate synthase [Bacteroidetes bacterium 46-16]|nr:MAG: thymidylate synthase [Bacteroidetes bacterium 46-16]